MQVMTRVEYLEFVNNPDNEELIAEFVNSFATMFGGDGMEDNRSIHVSRMLRRILKGRLQINQVPRFMQVNDIAAQLSACVAVGFNGNVYRLVLDKSVEGLEMFVGGLEECCDRAKESPVEDSDEVLGDLTQGCKRFMSDLICLLAWARTQPEMKSRLMRVVEVVDDEG